MIPGPNFLLSPSQRTRPTDYRGSHLEKSNEYHANFFDVSHQALLWRLEQRVLQKLVARYFPIEKPRHLDFACGTGRVLSLLQPLSATSTGVDVSKSMLSVAAQNSPRAELLESDLTRDNCLQKREFDLITAFRFLPNAEDSLRSEAVGVLSSLLSKRGILIVNNHLNSSSLARLLLTRTGRQPGHSMSSGEMVDLLAAHSLRVVETNGLAYLPLADRHVKVAPAFIQRLEQLITSAHRLVQLAQDQVVVAAHTLTSAGSD